MLEKYFSAPKTLRRLRTGLTLKIHDFRNTEGLAMVQIRYRGGFETKSEAFT
jgi:hypothetical protein